jgi:hypothetical protein
MDADKSGVIEINDIKGRYDASKHPDVIANKRTPEEVLRYVPFLLRNSFTLTL